MTNLLLKRVCGIAFERLRGTVAKVAPRSYADVRFLDLVEAFASIHNCNLTMLPETNNQARILPQVDRAGVSLLGPFVFAARAKVRCFAALIKPGKQLSQMASR
jgi:hypothetical protein